MKPTSPLPEPHVRRFEPHGPWQVFLRRETAPSEGWPRWGQPSGAARRGRGGHDLIKIATPKKERAVTSCDDPLKNSSRLGLVAGC